MSAETMRALVWDAVVSHLPDGALKEACAEERAARDRLRRLGERLREHGLDVIL